MSQLQDSLVELIRRTSAEIPDDVHRAILASLENEKAGTIAANAIKIIDQNIALARQKSQPICQDTGSILFYVDCPVGYDQVTFAETARAAVTLATKKGFLRQNSVDSLTGKNDGTNVGPGAPAFHFHQHRSPEISVRLVLKGGGCENVGAQYSLPDDALAGQPRPGRLPQGDSGRGVAGAGQGLRPGHSGRVHRRRPRDRLRIEQDAVSPPAWRTATRNRNWTRWSRTF